MPDDYRDLALEWAAADYLRLHDDYISALADAVTYRWLYLTLFQEWGKQVGIVTSLQNQLRQVLGVDAEP